MYLMLWICMYYILCIHNGDFYTKVISLLRKRSDFIHCVFVCICYGALLLSKLVNTVYI